MIGARVPPVLLAATLALTALVTTASIGGTTASPFVTTDEGLSGFVELASSMGYRVDTTLTTPIVISGQARDTLLVVVAPHREMTSTERDEVHELIAQGGRLLVADDLGPGGGLAPAFGVQYDRVRLYGTREGPAPSQSGERVDAVGDLGGRSFRIALDLPTSLSVIGDGGENLVVLANTTVDAFADLDDDRQIDADDVPGPLPVAYGVTGPDGGFQAAFLGDSGIMLNGILGQDENRAFVASLLEALLPRGGRIVVESGGHAGSVERVATAPLTAIVVGATRQPYPWAAIGITLLIVAVAVTRARGAEEWAPHRPRTDHAFGRAGDVKGLAERTRAALVTELPVLVRELASEGRVAELGNHVSDAQLAAFLAGKAGADDPARIAEMLDRFDRWRGTIRR